jgi:hypothetical protein
MARPLSKLKKAQSDAAHWQRCFDSAAALAFQNAVELDIWKKRAGLSMGIAGGLALGILLHLFFW